MDDTLERLGPEGVEAIVVAVPNMGTQRIDEYSPFRDPAKGGGRGDAYLDFLVRTLKPEVDRRFRTRHERTHTGHHGLVDGRPDQPLRVLPRARTCSASPAR